MAKRGDDVLWLPGLEWQNGAAIAPEPADARAREEALDTTRSFIVQAPAGSGKTEILTQRYLALLAGAAEPEGVVAITFTVKAAAEMRARILEGLAKADASAEPSEAHERITYRLAQRVLERDRKLNWHIRDNPGRLRIQTIDALCAFIARQMPWTARLGAMPAVIEDATELYAEAARRTVELLDDPDPRTADAVETLLSHVENDASNAESLIVRMLAQRDQWLRLTGIGADMTEVRPRLEAPLARTVAQGLRAALDAVPEWAHGELAALARYAASQLRAVHELACIPGTHTGCLDEWLFISDLLLTDKGEWRSRPNKANGFPSGTPEKRRITELLDAFSNNDALKSSLCALRRLPAPAFEETQWRVMEAAFMLLPRAAAELNVVFAECGQVDFAEIALRSREALGDADAPTDWGLVFGARIEHLLVDEFQDTSELQFELLRCATAGWVPGDGRTLFLVGDPMQSIYRFRQADVGLFLKARSTGIGELVPEPLSLSANFRSLPSIVEWVNRTFAQVLPQTEDMDTGAVAYSESVPFRQGAVDDTVVVHPLFGRDDDAEAETALRAIQSAKAEDPDGKIAVLVRARTHLPEVARRLRAAGLPFRAVEIETLAERPVVQDLLALTRALLHVGDRLSWLAILRAPWCGMTLADLHAIAASDKRAPVWTLLQNATNKVSAEGRAALDRVLPVLRRALESAGRVGLRSLVESTWVRLGGPQCLESESDLDDARAFLELLEQSESGGDLPSLELFAERVAKLFAQPDAEAGESLQLMTIHKAKGLEFDTVIVPGLGRSTRSDEQQLLVWVERQGPNGPELLMSPASPRGKSDAVCSYVTRLDREKGRNEAARLLYVACTRAKKRLHLIGATRVKADGEMNGPEMDSLLAHLWPAVETQYRANWETPRETMEKPGDIHAFEPRPIRRLPAKWAAPAWPESLEWNARGEPPRIASQEAFEQVDEVFRATGTVIHAMLERIAREPVEQWDADHLRSARPGIQAALLTAGVPGMAVAHALERVEAALSTALADSRGRWLLGAHEHARSEFELTGLVDGSLFRAVIDRTFVDEGGVRWIVDYKTGTPPAGVDAEKYLDGEQQKYQPQLERYATLFAHVDVRPIRLALYFPLFAGWREWSAGESVPIYNV